MSCHTEVATAHQNCYPIQSGHSDVGPTSLRTNPVKLQVFARTASRLSNLYATGMTRMEIAGRFFFFLFFVPSYIFGAHHSSSSLFPAVSLGFTFLLLLCSQLYLWGSPFFFFFCVLSYNLWRSPFFSFCVPSYISGANHAYSSSSAFPAISLGFTILLLLRSQLYLWGSPFFFFVPSYISGLTILLLLRSQLYLWDSPFFFFVPSYISGLTILLLHSQLYRGGSPFFFFCVPSYISGIHHSSSSSSFPVLSLGLTILFVLHPQLYLRGSQFFSFFVPSYISRALHFG